MTAIQSIRSVFLAGVLCVGCFTVNPIARGEDEQRGVGLKGKRHELIQDEQMGRLMNMLLARSLHVCSRALDELQDIFSAPTAQRAQDGHGFWYIIKEDETRMVRVDFASQTGPPKEASSAEFRDSAQFVACKEGLDTGVHWFGYVMEFGPDGEIQSFKQLVTGENLRFHPNGMLKYFSVGLTEDRPFGAEWDPQGKFLRAGVRDYRLKK